MRLISNIWNYYYLEFEAFWPGRKFRINLFKKMNIFKVKNQGKKNSVMHS